MQAICVCEFDNHVGPSVCFQEPSEFLSPDMFEQISDYLIPFEDLCDKLITLNAFGSIFVGCPIRLEHAKYARNCLIFNLVFVLSTKTDPEPYQRIVKKLANILKTLELENEFFSDRSKRARLAVVLPQIFAGLRDQGQCSVFVDLSNVINLKLFPSRPASIPEIHLHAVPVLIAQIGNLNTIHWDLTIKRILPAIDGINYISRIARLCDMDIDLVEQCIRQLHYFGLVCLIDIFQFTNMYCAIPGIHALATDPALQSRCIAYITQGRSSNDVQQVTVGAILNLYSLFRRGRRIRQICEADPMFKSGVVDIRKLLTFGLVNGFLRRVFVYPMLIDDQPKKQKFADGSFVDHLRSLLTGRHSLDEICCRLDCSRKEISNAIGSIRNCFMIMR